MKTVIIGLIAVLVIGAGGYMLLSGNDETPASKNQPADNAVTENTASEENDAASENAATLTYDGEEFTPAEITVKKGTIITVKNSSSRVLDFASDDHPTHEINSELNIGEIAPGKSGTFSPGVGEWGYHDHLNDSAVGRVIVTDE